jgi:hypothetical protein
VSDESLYVGVIRRLEAERDHARAELAELRPKLWQALEDRDLARGDRDRALAFKRDGHAKAQAHIEQLKAERDELAAQVKTLEESEVDWSKHWAVVTLSELERLAKAATPGPWVASEGRSNTGFVGVYESGVGFPVASTSVVWERAEAVELADARYIAAASPDVVLALLAVVDAARNAAVLIQDAVSQRGTRGSGGMGSELQGDPLSYIQPSAMSQLERIGRDLTRALAAVPNE